MQVPAWLSPANVSEPGSAILGFSTTTEPRRVLDPRGEAFPLFVQTL